MTCGKGCVCGEEEREEGKEPQVSHLDRPGRGN